MRWEGLQRVVGRDYICRYRRRVTSRYEKPCRHSPYRRCAAEAREDAESRAKPALRGASFRGLSGYASGFSHSPASILAALLIANSRVEHAVEQIYAKVNNYEGDSVKENDVLNYHPVAFRYAVDQCGAETGHGKRPLHGDGAAKQECQAECRIWLRQGRSAFRSAWRAMTSCSLSPFRPCGSHVVLPEHFQQRGTAHPG